MLETINNLLGAIDDFVWGVPLIVLILATGIYLTIRVKCLQIYKLPRAIHYMFHSESEDLDGEVSSFAALCTALSATIGTGNIVGVATAIVAGGPGALFWMWIAAFLGTATKYAEGLLAVKYRTVAEDGHIVGGPFYYIEKGMGEKWKWLAKLFAFFGVGVGLFGIGTFTQVNGITSAANNFFDPNNAHMISLFGRDYSWSVVIAGLILAFCVGLVVIGGLKRISQVSQVVVPFMAVIYVIAAITILICNVKQIPAAFVTIIQSAFGMRAAAGGAAVVALSYLMGVGRYNGAGMDVIMDAVELEQALPWDFVCKMVLTVLTLSVGFKGGEVVPSFYIGATFGCVVGPLLGLPAGFSAAVGLVCVFCGATNTLVASIVLAAELFSGAGFELMALACGLSYMFSGYHSLYSSQGFRTSKLFSEFLQPKEEK